MSGDGHVRAARRMLYAARALTILAAIAAGFGFLVWKRHPRPLEYEVVFVPPKQGGWELFLADGSRGHGVTHLSIADVERRGEDELATTAWPPPGMERDLGDAYVDGRTHVRAALGRAPARGAEDEEDSVLHLFQESVGSAGSSGRGHALRFRVLDEHGDIVRKGFRAQMTAVRPGVVEWALVFDVQAIR